MELGEVKILRRTHPRLEGQGQEEGYGYDGVSESHGWLDMDIIG